MIPPPFEERPSWMKSRGYLHITPKINIYKRYVEMYGKLHSEKFIIEHGFFPLIHSVIKERKYKKKPDGKGRAHSYLKKGKYESSAKKRPLHYATHIDALIFGRYAAILHDLYEEKLKEVPSLDDCIIAYRKILVDELEEDLETPPGKSTIHFANEAFEEIKKRAATDCVVLMFDIKSFFSELDHKKLKETWCDLLQVKELDKAHFNVFRAATEFRYILRDDLRINPERRGKRSGFDEKKLAKIRKHEGIEAFFSSVTELKQAIETKKIKVFKHPFMKNGRPCGIPQGLPISAVLANLYLLEFDKAVLQKLTEVSGFYRRYSDDILIICKPEQATEIEKFVLTEIQKSAVCISQEKTEKYFFGYQQISPKINRIMPILLSGKTPILGKPLTYLGFEFYGYKTLIKSANVAKYYRRMIYGVKKRADRAIKIAQANSSSPAIYHRQLRKIYNDIDLGQQEPRRKRKILVKNADGYFHYKLLKTKPKPSSNYFAYTRRSADIMNEPKIEKQLRKHRGIFNAAVARHLKKKIE